jgi:ribosome biogenesis protein SSF1/2
MKLSEARRVALFNYNSDKKTIDFRHFTITVAPVGLSKSVKRIIQTNIPNLSDVKDISEYILKGAAASESDGEDMDDSKVELPQRYLGRGNSKDQQRAVKLVEIGPRIEMKLIKVQKDLCGGEVLYHDFSLCFL